MSVKFAEFSKEEQEIVDRIVERALPLLPHRSPLDIQMDISAVHARNPLRLADMVEADDFNFAHDIGGITRHLNRETGKLENFFLPRFTVRD